LDEGNPSAAYAIFKKLYERDRYNEEVLNGMAIALMRMGKFEESEGYLRELLKISNKDIYLANLGNLYYRMGDVEKAIRIYGEVLKKNPQCYVALNNLAKCLMDKGENEKAAMLLKRALEINPNNEVANRNYYMLTAASNKKEIEEGII
jgi:tetratricopeptide (TPR) repeat protein